MNLHNRFEYHAPDDPSKVEAHQKVRQILRDAALEIDDLLDDSREKSLAITQLEQAMFWANAGLARP